jgi:hypothetical protein
LETRTELVKLFPELAAWLPEIIPTSSLDPEQEKHRLFESLSQFLSRLAVRLPLHNVIEDLHWSDDNTLDFLLHFERRLPTLPILLILTFRNDGANPRLDHFRALLDRERRARELTLAPLTAEQVDLMIRISIQDCVQRLRGIGQIGKRGRVPRGISHRRGSQCKNEERQEHGQNEETYRWNELQSLHCFPSLGANGTGLNSLRRPTQSSEQKYHQRIISGKNKPYLTVMLPLADGASTASEVSADVVVFNVPA